MAGMNIKDLKKHIQEGSEAMLASLNPFGAVYREIEHLKTFLSTVLLIEYSVLTVSVLISVVLSHSYVRSSDYEDYSELGSAQEP